MKKWTFAILAALAISAVSFEAGSLQAQPEQAMHPRLATAIDALVDARAYLEAAPHDFGGHKASAIRAIDAALRELRASLSYRGAVDRHHGH